MLHEFIIFSYSNRTGLQVTPIMLHNNNVGKPLDLQKRLGVVRDEEGLTPLGLPSLCLLHLPSLGLLVILPLTHLVYS